MAVNAAQYKIVNLHKTLWDIFYDYLSQCILCVAQDNSSSSVVQTPQKARHPCDYIKINLDKARYWYTLSGADAMFQFAPFSSSFIEGVFMAFKVPLVPSNESAKGLSSKVTRVMHFDIFLCSFYAAPYEHKFFWKHFLLRLNNMNLKIISRKNKMGTSNKKEEWSGRSSVIRY